MNKLLRLIVIIFSAGLANPAQTLPQTATSDTRELGLPFIRNYSPKEYCAHAQNWTIAQDKRGVMYFGNGTGVLEYDGVSWRLLQLPNKSIVRALARSEDGNRIYVGGFGDFGYFAPDSFGQMRHVSLLPFVPEAQRNIGDVWTVHATAEGVYYQTRERLFRLTPNAGNTGWQVKAWQPQTNFMFTFWLDSTLYVHQRGVGLMKMEADSLHLLPGSEALGNDRMQVMLPFSDGKKYLLGLFNGNLFTFDGRTFAPFRCEARVVNILANNYLYKGTVLADGSFALASAQNGLTIIDAQGRLLRYISQASGLQDNTVYAVHADRATGQLWLASDKGISRVDITAPLSHFDAQSGITSAVLAIYRHQGRLYVATTLGVLWFDPAASTFRQVLGLGYQTFGLLSIGETLLAGANDGLFQITGDRAQVIRASLAGDFQASALHFWHQDPRYLFIALFDAVGVMRRSGDTWIDEGTIPGVNEQTWHFLESADGSLWLGTGAQGVVRLSFPESDEGISRIRNARVERFGPEQGLPDGAVAALSANGREYFVSLAGVFRFDESQKRFVPDSTFEDISRGGDPNEYRIKTDNRDRVWISFGRECAVGLPQGDGSYQIEKAPFLPFADISMTAIIPEDNGIVWFGGTDGVIRYDSNLQKNYNATFTTLIRRVVVGEDSLIFGGTADKSGGVETSRRDVSTLANSFNTLHFEYAAPFFEQENKTQYQTFLDGFDKNWSAWHRNSQKEYTNLPEGDYRFRVRAKNIYQHESEEGIYAFKILPPWYRSAWAYGGYVLFLGLIAFTAYRVQHARLVKRERQSAELLSRIGKDITASLDSDTIFYKLYENVNQLIDATIFGVGVYHPEQEQIEYRLAIERGKRYKPYSRDMIDKNQFPVWCIENRQPIFINDVKREYNRYISRFDTANVEGMMLEDGQTPEEPQSLIYLPLIAKEKVLGIITVQSFRKDAYSSYHLHVLQNLAAYTTIAMDNANVYRELNTLLANLEKTVEERTTEIQTQKENVELLSEIGKEITASLDMDTIFFKLYENVNRLADASIFGVGVYHPEKQQIEYRLAIEKGKRYAPYSRDTRNRNQFPVWCLENRQPVFINDVMQEYGRYISEYEEPKEVVLEDGSAYEKAHSMIYLPLVAQNRVLGIITMQSFRKHAYTDYHLSILQNLAAYTTVALDNARLFAEAQQARAAAEEANEAKSSFLSTVSHELRTPLTSVLGFAKIIKKRLEERILPLLKTDDSKVQRSIDQVTENLNVVVAEGERLTTLINNVLDLAKIEAGKIEWHEEKIEIADLIERATAATSSLFDSSGLQCCKEIAPDLPEVVGDRDKLIQVVINLISNAVKFTDKGSVTCRALSDQAKGEIVVSIIDTGMGIAPEDQPKVFEKFKQVGETLTNKPKGTGLGLTICREIVEHHGGRIWVESEIGVGSTFSFALPLKTAAEREGKMAPVDFAALMAQLKQRVQTTAMKPKDGKPSILVVDDEASIRELLNQNLQEAGYHVRVAANGREALEQIRREPPDLVILDVMMPEMNGFDVAAVLKNDPATMDIPILILSIVQDRERGFRLGIDRYLTKPIDTEALFREVGALLEQGKSHRKVMIVDEDASTVKTLAEVLQARGYHVVETNGAELIKKAVSEKPDIIILSSILSEKQDVVRTLRFENGLEDVLFLVYQ